jgi:hypothetical protein
MRYQLTKTPAMSKNTPSGYRLEELKIFIVEMATSKNPEQLN